MAFKLEKIVQYYPKLTKPASADETEMHKRKGLKIPLSTDIAGNLGWHVGTPILIIERENFLIVRKVDAALASKQALEDLSLIGDLTRFMPESRAGGPSRKSVPKEQGELLRA